MNREEISREITVKEQEIDRKERELVEEKERLEEAMKISSDMIKLKRSVNYRISRIDTQLTDIFISLRSEIGDDRKNEAIQKQAQLESELEDAKKEVVVTMEDRDYSDNRVQYLRGKTGRLESELNTLKSELFTLSNTLSEIEYSQRSGFRR